MTTPQPPPPPPPPQQQQQQQHNPKKKKKGKHRSRPVGGFSDNGACAFRSHHQPARLSDALLPVGYCSSAHH
jgi:hypothetical protein